MKRQRGGSTFYCGNLAGALKTDATCAARRKKTTVSAQQAQRTLSPWAAVKAMREVHKRNLPPATDAVIDAPYCGNLAGALKTRATRTARRKKPTVSAQRVPSPWAVKAMREVHKRNLPAARDAAIDALNSGLYGRGKGRRPHPRDAVERAMLAHLESPTPETEKKLKFMMNLYQGLTEREARYLWEYLHAPGRSAAGDAAAMEDAYQRAVERARLKGETERGCGCP